MRRTMTPVAVSLLAIALAACGSDEPEPASGPAKPAVTARAGAGDPPGPGDTVSIEIDVSGLELDANAIGGENAEGRGHYHVYWDEVMDDEPAAVAATERTEVTVPDHAVDGTHTIIVSLRNNDHSALVPPSRTTVEVTVSGGAPRPAVSWTADNVTALQAGDTITLQIEVENFTLDAGRAGDENQSGVGHYHVYWDDASGEDFIAMGAEPSLRLQVPEDATDGSHKITVSLRNNDHSSLVPSAESEDWVLVYRLD